MVAPQGQAVGNSLALPSHKRPWEEDPPHISRATINFERNILDQKEPREIHSGWVERPPKKHRSKPNHNHSYQPDTDEPQTMKEWLRRQDEEEQSHSEGRRDPPSLQSQTRHSNYTPGMWRRTGNALNRYSGMSAPKSLEVDDTNSEWRVRNNYTALNESNRQKNLVYPDAYSQPPPRAQPRRVDNDSHRDEENYAYHKEVQEEPRSSILENKIWSQRAQPTYHQQETLNHYHPEPAVYQPQRSYQHSPPKSPLKQQHYQDLTTLAARRDTKQSVKDANCPKCQSALPALRDFKVIIDQMHETFGLFGPYEEIHMDYSGWGMEHTDIPGFAELHRLTDVMYEASKLAAYVVMCGTLLQERIKAEKIGKEAKVIFVDTELARLKRELAMDLEWFDDLSTRHEASPSARTEEARGNPREAAMAYGNGDIRREPADDFAEIAKNSRSWTAEYKDEIIGDYQHDQQSKRPSSTGNRPSSSSYTQHPGYERMKPPPVPQQELSPASSNDRRKTMTQSPNPYTALTPLSSRPEQSERIRPTSGNTNGYRPLSPAYTSTSIQSSVVIEPANAKRSFTSNATFTALAATQIPTFKVKDPAASATIEAKLKNLKAKLEAEISEVDNLTEEKKRLEDRCKELEGMVEEERNRRREVQEMNMKERKQFLGVVENVVTLGRREGGKKASSRMMVKREKDGEKDEDGGGGIRGAGDSSALQGEVERLRERNRVCESALEHIQRESRHMEDTAGKLNESRRGIDLVLGRVLAGSGSAAGSAIMVEG